MIVLLKLPDVEARTGLAKPTIYARAKSGLFPPPVKIGKRASAWPADEIASVSHAYIAGKTEDEIRELVARIVRERTGLAV